LTSPNRFEITAMPRFSEKAYRRRVWLAMTAYVGCMLLLWPQLHVVSGPVLKVALALLPVVPMLYLISLMWRRVRHSDELQQRTHLVALGVATMVVSALSLGAGFLAAAQVLVLRGDILIWVFPVILVCYDLTRWWVGRRYGVMGTCEEAPRFPVYLRLLLAAAAIALGALVYRHQVGERQFDAFLGMACVLAAAGVLAALVRWRTRQHHDGDAS
jgi:hypothetical protein